ncbi:hypothetical protein D3C87_599440 [compost metagenome]
MLGTPLVDDRQGRVELLGEGAGARHAAHVGRDDGQILEVLAADIVDQDRQRLQMIHEDIEEPLYLRSMQVHGQHAGGAGGGDEIRHQLRGDGLAACGLAVLAGVGVVGNHGRDGASTRTLEGVEHDAELHHVVVDRVTDRLDQEDIRPANRILDLDIDLAIREVGDLDATKLSAQLAGNLLGQGRVCRTGEELHGAVRNAGAIPRSLGKDARRIVNHVVIPLRCRTHPSLTTWRARPSAKAPSGTSETIVDPAAV